MSNTEIFVIGVVFGVALYAWFLNSQDENRREIPKYARAKWTQKRTWKAFTPESFEWLVAEYFTIEGYNVLLKQASRDEGIDLILTDDDGEKIAVQVKRYKPDNKISAPTVRNSVGAANQIGIKRTIIVTTSEYTQPAKNARDDFKSNGNDVYLIDGEKLMADLNKTNLLPPWPPNFSEN